MDIGTLDELYWATKYQTNLTNAAALAQALAELADPTLVGVMAKRPSIAPVAAPVAPVVAAKPVETK